jgi:hypothetical protein
MPKETSATGEDARFTMADCHAKIVKGGLATEYEDDF